MRYLHATKYPANERTIALRREQQRDETHIPLWVWCDPYTGGVYGTDSTQYAKFDTMAEAEATAIAHGYEVIK